jgi:hypothetical protein
MWKEIDIIDKRKKITRNFASGVQCTLLSTFNRNPLWHLWGSVEKQKNLTPDYAYTLWIGCARTCAASPKVSRTGIRLQTANALQWGRRSELVWRFKGPAAPLIWICLESGGEWQWRREKGGKWDLVWDTMFRHVSSLTTSIYNVETCITWNFKSTKQLLMFIGLTALSRKQKGNRRRGWLTRSSKSGGSDPGVHVKPEFTCGLTKRDDGSPPPNAKTKNERNYRPTSSLNHMPPWRRHGPLYVHVCTHTWDKCSLFKMRYVFTVPSVSFR